MLRRNVLIFHSGGLGDFVLSWPFAVAMARIYAQSRIVFVTQGQKGELAKKVVRLESRGLEAGWHGLYSADPKLPDAAADLLRATHAVYSFLPVTEDWHRAVASIAPTTKRVVIDAKVPASYPGHASQFLLESLQDLKVEQSATDQILRSVADRGIGFKPAGGGGVLIHPGSGGAAKCWPIEHFVDLAKRLVSSGKKVRFVVGETEIERWNAKTFDRLTAAASVIRPANLTNLLDEISTADCFVGNDSGPAHLAGIIGVKTVAVFDPTDPAVWRPLGPRVTALRGHPAAVADVFAAVSE